MGLPAASFSDISFVSVNAFQASSVEHSFETLNLDALKLSGILCCEHLGAISIDVIICQLPLIFWLPALDVV